MQKGLDTDIAAAKARGRHVILVTRAFPGTSASNFNQPGWIPDEGHQPKQYSYPKAAYLGVPSSPNNPAPLDGPYWQWVTYLMMRYHPNNTASPAVINGRGRRLTTSRWSMSPTTRSARGYSWAPSGQR